jgi:hypothetical protein
MASKDTGDGDTPNTKRVLEKAVTNEIGKRVRLRLANNHSNLQIFNTYVSDVEYYMKWEQRHN